MFSRQLNKCAWNIEVRTRGKFFVCLVFRWQIKSWTWIRLSREREWNEKRIENSIIFTVQSLSRRG